MCLFFTFLPFVIRRWLVLIRVEPPVSFWWNVRRYYHKAGGARSVLFPCEVTKQQRPHRVFYKSFYRSGHRPQQRFYCRPCAATALDIQKSCLYCMLSATHSLLFFFLYLRKVESSASAFVVAVEDLVLGLSAKGNNWKRNRHKREKKLVAYGAMMELCPSRQLVVTLSGTLAARSLAQDAREAGGTVAALVVVARAAVLTAQHRVVAHPSCRHKTERAAETGRRD